MVDSRCHLRGVEVLWPEFFVMDSRKTLVLPILILFEMKRIYRLHSGCGEERPLVSYIFHYRGCGSLDVAIP